ncbi:MAG: DUF3159 domain-containing protein [Actinomycetales bacterium]|nr:DUF3159 domain-containing protein [Actinomycetales bacterium]
MSHERLSIRHAIDGGIPFLLFFVGYQLHSIAVGCLLALISASALAFLRVKRGEPRVAVLLGVFAVALSATIALAVGEGRSFFVTSLITNAIGLLVTAASLAFKRPVTGFVGKRLKREKPGWYDDPVRYQTHKKMTWFWVFLWVWHLAALLPLYALDKVAALALLTTFVLKPSLPLWVVISLMWGKRSRERQAGQPKSTASGSPGTSPENGTPQ